MALIDVVRWAPDSDEFVFAYKIPETNLSTYTQLVVHESQEAVLFSKGRLMGKFGPGKHTLNTENLPLLRNFFGIPFGGKNPFTAEIWIVNMLMPVNFDWSTNRMTIHDSDYQTQLPLVASGQYGLKVVDSEKFLINMVGTKTEFTEQDVTDQAYGEFSTKAKSAIMKFMLTNHVGFKQISAYLDSLSNFLSQSVQPFWDTYGLQLTKFYVSSIDIDDSTPDGRKIKEAISQQSTMSITGHTWQQEQAFDMANNAVEQMGRGIDGSGGGLLSGLLAINMMNNMQGSMGGGMMNTQYDQPTFGGSASTVNVGGSQGTPTVQKAPKMVYCANCSRRHLSTEKYCPYCGHEYNPCPVCGADNLPDASRCVSCGTVLKRKSQSVNICPKCGAPIAPGALFCSNCGYSLKSSDVHTCPRCGASLPPSTKFCPNCGYQIQQS